MKQIIKNYLICMLSFISFTSHAQRYSDEYVSKRDTLGVIKLLNPEHSAISIKKGNLEFKFGKDTTIAILKENIKLMEPIQNRPEYPFIKKQIDDLQKIIGFLSNNKSLVIEPADRSYEEAKNKIETLAAYYLNDLFYCDFIDAGNFELFKNGIQQINILKVKFYYSDAVSGAADDVYFLKGEQKGIWVCSLN